MKVLMPFGLRAAHQDFHHALQRGGQSKQGGSHEAACMQIPGRTGANQCPAASLGPFSFSFLPPLAIPRWS